MVEHMFRYRRFVWMSKPYMPEVIFYSGLCRSTSLSDVHLTTLTGYDVYPRSPQAQVVDNGTQESGDLLGGSPTHLMLRLANIPLSWPYVAWTYGRRATEVGLSVGLEVLIAGLRAQLICLILQSFSLKVVLRNSNSSWRCSLSHRGLAESTASMLEGRWSDSESRYTCVCVCRSGEYDNAYHNRTMTSTWTKRIGSSWRLFKLACSNKYKIKFWKDK